MQKLKRTHTLPPPDDEEALRWLARAAHMRPRRAQRRARVLNAEIKRNSHRVRRLHAKLFYRPLLESVARIDKEALRLSPDAAVRSWPRSATRRRRTRSATSPPSPVGRPARDAIQALLLPTLLEWLGDTPDPDAGLLAYRRLSDAWSTPRVLRLLRDEASVAQRLMTVLGSSAYIPDLLIKAPDVIRLFADGPVRSATARAAARGRRARHPVVVERVRRPGGAIRCRPLAAPLRAGARRERRHPRHARRPAGVQGAVVGVGGGTQCRARDGDPRARGGGGRARTGAVRGDRQGRSSAAANSATAPTRTCCSCASRTRASTRRGREVGQQIGDRVLYLPARSSTEPPALEVDIGLRTGDGAVRWCGHSRRTRRVYAQWAQAWEVQALCGPTRSAGGRRAGAAVPAHDRQDPIPRGWGVGAGGAGDPADQGPRRLESGCRAAPTGHAHQARSRRPRRHRVDRAADPVAARARDPVTHHTSTLETLDAIGAAEFVERERRRVAARRAWLLATKARNRVVLVRGKPTDQLPGTGQGARRRRAGGRVEWAATPTSSSTTTCGHPAGEGRGQRVFGGRIVSEVGSVGGIGRRGRGTARLHVRRSDEIPRAQRARRCGARVQGARTRAAVAGRGAPDRAS